MTCSFVDSTLGCVSLSLFRYACSKYVLPMYNCVTFNNTWWRQIITCAYFVATHALIRAHLALQAHVAFRVLWFTTIKACINTVMVMTGWKKSGVFKVTPKLGQSAEEAAISTKLTKTEEKVRVKYTSYIDNHFHAALIVVRCELMDLQLLLCAPLPVKIDDVRTSD